MKRAGSSGLVVVVAVAGVGLVAGTAFGQVWSFDSVNSTLDLQSDVLADEYSTAGVVTDAEAVNFFVPNYQGSTYLYDWGNGVNPVARDDPSGPPIVVSSAGALVGIRGVGTSTLHVRWKSSTLLDSEYCYEGFFGTAVATALSTLRGSIDGLTPADAYSLFYDWELFAVAQTDHEGLYEEDPEYAAGSLTFDLGGFGPGDIFSVEVNSDDPNLPGSLSLTGGDVITFVPATASLPLTVDVYATADAEFAVGDIEFDDLAGSQFVGDLWLTVIPEPGAAILLSVGSLLALRRRR